MSRLLHLSHQAKVTAVAFVVLVVLAVVALSTAKGLAATQLTAHNNYGSDRTVTMRVGTGTTGTLKYVYAGQTVSMGYSGYRVYIARGTCIRHGMPGTTEARKTCATATAGTSFSTTMSQWFDVVPL